MIVDIDDQEIIQTEALGLGVRMGGDMIADSTKHAIG